MSRADQKPTCIVIFGATGDLARRKLLPALFHLFSNGFLPEHIRIVGFARDPMLRPAFQEFAREVIATQKPQHRASELTEFCALLDYQTGLFEDKQSYQTLATVLSSLDETTFHACSNKLFYLAVPPTQYETIFEHLAHSGLTIPCGGAQGWTRVLVEKPFGRDLATAQSLDRKLGKLFHEEQIFRIDHYLAKETVQNIISFRFANAIFEPVWNRNYVASVSIVAHETIGVGQRASFYEDTGALRDVGQNHLLQMLALVAMEDPLVLEAAAIRTARANVLQHLRPLSTTDILERTVRGQYRGYRAEADVAAASQTETFFRLTAYLDNERWRDVPFFLESGKKMTHNQTEITVNFRQGATCVCPPGEHKPHHNRIQFRIQPDEGISVVFWAKKPGLLYELEPKTLTFYYKDSETVLQLPDAYEKVLYDCIRGDQTLFASTAEVSAAWQFITPILQLWSTTPLHEYEPGGAVTVSN